MHVLTRNGAVLVSGAALALVAAAPSVADPTHGELIPVTCGGVTYQVAVNGNGAWTPGHDTASTTMFIPTSFGEIHGTVTDSAGTIVDEFTVPPAVRGASDKPRSTSVSCTFEDSGTFEDPDLGILTFHVTGSVEGFTTPAH